MGTTSTVGNWRLDRAMNDASESPRWTLYRPPTNRVARASAPVADLQSRQELLTWLERSLVPTEEAGRLADLWEPVRPGNPSSVTRPSPQVPRGWRRRD